MSALSGGPLWYVALKLITITGPDINFCPTSLLPSSVPLRMVSPHIRNTKSAFSTQNDLLGIYTSIIASAVLLVIRVARPRGHFLGRVAIHGQDDSKYREIFVPMDSTKRSGPGVLNPHIKIDAPAPGVVIYRPEESVLYPNSSLITASLVDHIKTHTKRGKDMTNVPVS